jgi:ribosomal protein L37AE/L43A
MKFQRTKAVSYITKGIHLCNKCGKQGHKGADCRVRPENYVKAVEEREEPL